MIRPPALRYGARIALVAPAGPLASDAVDAAISRISQWGWVPVLGAHARNRTGYLAGTDSQRAADFNEALHSDQNDAIWCLRGGYGTMRIIDGLDWNALSARPRPLIGFSDNTALHLAAQRAGVVSLHGPHPASRELPEFSKDLLLQTLTGTLPGGPLPFPPGGSRRGETIRGGLAEGPLVGGNLSLIAATLGTPYAIRAEGSILFLEEVGEPAYRIDRLLSHLRLAGIFSKAAGIVIGAFSECPDEAGGHLPSPAEVIRDRLHNLEIPSAMGFPFGHIAESWTLPLGISARLDASAGTLELLQTAVVG
ncbi:LD-carboxypeptidase [soil metagenome]